MRHGTWSPWHWAWYSKHAIVLTITTPTAIIMMKKEEKEKRKRRRRRRKRRRRRRNRKRRRRRRGRRGRRRKRNWLNNNTPYNNSVGFIVTNKSSFSKMKKLRSGEVKYLAPSHTIRKGQKMR